VRPAVMGSSSEARQRIEQVVFLSDVVKASDEDLEWLYPRRSVEESAREWAAHRANVAVVVTHGSSGATCFTSRGEARSPGVVATVVDTIGAGDTFCAAMLDALWTRELLGAAARPALHALSISEWRDVLSFAARAASVTVSRPGADPPYRDEIPAAAGCQWPSETARRWPPCFRRGHH
jgi:fructokinase